jgi:hypothetical protein
VERVEVKETNTGFGRDTRRKDTTWKNWVSLGE